MYFSCLPNWYTSPALITDLINEAIGECKYQISYANDHTAEKTEKYIAPAREFWGSRNYECMKQDVVHDTFLKYTDKQKSSCGLESVAEVLGKEWCE